MYYDHEQPEVFVGHIVKSRVRIWIQIDTGEQEIPKMWRVPKFVCQIYIFLHLAFESTEICLEDSLKN